MLTKSEKKFRSNSCDWEIWDNIVNKNEYNLPENLFNCVIVDIGAHIGSFSYACLKRGAKFVYAYEAHPENAEIAHKNLSTFKNKIEINNLAVWRSDIKVDFLNHTGFPVDESNNLINTGGGNVWSNIENIKIPTISLREVIDKILLRYDKIDIVKLDCEGSEFVILLTTDLKNIDKIIGEFHEFKNDHDHFRLPDNIKLKDYDEFTIDTLITYLQLNNFYVNYDRSKNKNCKKIGKFFASYNI